MMIAVVSENLVKYKLSDVFLYLFSSKDAFFLKAIPSRKLFIKKQSIIMLFTLSVISEALVLNLSAFFAKNRFQNTT